MAAVANLRPVFVPFDADIAFRDIMPRITPRGGMAKAQMRLATDKLSTAGAPEDIVLIETESAEVTSSQEFPSQYFFWPPADSLYQPAGRSLLFTTSLQILVMQLLPNVLKG